MTDGHIHAAAAWLSQAERDARTATALLDQPTPMKTDDVGCHVASLCAQAVEKSIKGYVLLNRSAPSHRSHRADKYLTPLLRGDLLRYGDNRRKLAGLFDPSMRALVRRLFDLTPGVPWGVWMCRRPSTLGLTNMGHRRQPELISSQTRRGSRSGQSRRGASAPKSPSSSSPCDVSPSSEPGPTGALISRARSLYASPSRATGACKR